MASIVFWLNNFLFKDVVVKGVFGLEGYVCVLEGYWYVKDVVVKSIFGSLFGLEG